MDEEPPKKKRGRKPGKQLVSREGRAHRFYSHSVTEQLRERADPKLVADWFFMIASGKNPVWILDKNRDPIGVEEDPSPNAQPPTLNQKNEAIKEVLNRREGMAPQVHHIEAMIKGTIQPELPPGIMEAFNPQALVYIAKALELAASSDNSDAIDAEFTERVEATESGDGKGEVPEQ